jgi:hypothetical protein
MISGRANKKFSRWWEAVYYAVNIMPFLIVART